MKTLRPIFFQALCLSLFFSQFARSQNNALRFDGIDDDVSFAYHSALDFSIGDKFTIEAWVNTTGSIGILYSNLVHISPYKGYEMGFSGGHLFIQLINSFPSNCLRIETGSTFNDGAWHHVAFVYKAVPNASNVELYVDGILQTPVVTHNSLSGAFSNGQNAHIGSRDATTFHLVGALDEVRLWSRALCSNEIIGRRDCHLTGNEQGLTAYYNFDHGSAGGANAGITNLADISGNNFTGTLNFFSLSGNSSNWVASGAPVGTVCPIYSGAVTISYAGSSTLCPGESATLTANAGTGATYSWIAAGTGSTIVVSPLISTVYTVSTTGPSVCPASNTILVYIGTAPTLVVNGPGPSCAGNTVNLAASGASGYTWQPGNLTGFYVTVTPTISTTYTVYGKGLSGCVGQATFQQHVITCDPVGIAEDGLYAPDVFPVPFGNTLWLSGLSKSASVKILDGAGKTVMTARLSGPDAEIDAADLAPGLYILIVEESNKVYRTKIFKE